MDTQFKCSSIGEWITNLWYIYTMKYYIAVKMNELEALTNKESYLYGITQM